MELIDETRKEVVVSYFNVFLPEFVWRDKKITEILRMVCFQFKIQGQNICTVIYNPYISAKKCNCVMCIKN